MYVDLYRQRKVAISLIHLVIVRFSFISQPVTNYEPNPLERSMFEIARLNYFSL